MATLPPSHPPTTSQASPDRAGDDTPPFRYTAALADQIETRWQRTWEERGTFITPNPGQAGFDGSRPKFYCLDMFPYPSGAGLHVGHPVGYTASDMICRYMRMRGANVLHPMGWDAFGLPAEQYAIATGVHPAITTRKAIDNFRRQLKRFGFCYDWSREFGTIDPEYYRWTQWIFLKAYDAWYDTEQNRARPIAELMAGLSAGVYGVGPAGQRIALDRGDLAPAVTGSNAGVRQWHELSESERRAFIDDQRLVYLGETTVNWCPALGTVLANDEVIDGKSERGGHPVFRKPLKQWMFRITAYAQRLLDDLALVEWPESTKTMQAEWIGRSEGAEIDFEILGTPPLRGGAFETPSERSSESRAAEPDSVCARDFLFTPAHAQLVGAAAARFSQNGLEAMRPVGFLARDPYPPGVYGPVEELIVTRRNLPHCNLPGATYFVTWKTMNDGALSDTERDAALRALTHFDGERCRVYAAVVMSNHVHWIVRPYDETTLDQLVASVKRFSSTEINGLRGGKGHVWEPERFDHIIRNTTYFNEFTAYVVNNPVKAGVVARANDYRWTVVHPDVLGGNEGDAASEAERRVGEDPEPASERRGTPLRVFTTRPDTIFGATYMVVAPEHWLVEHATRHPAPGCDVAALKSYVAASRNKADVDRMADTKEKTGVFTGVYCINPATGQRIPVWTADYVLVGYGHGAIMAVPAHDERDYAFAVKFKLPIVDVVYPRTMAAMAYFAEHAPPQLTGEDVWVRALADFLGLVTTASAEPAMFEEGLQAILERRVEPPSVNNGPNLDELPPGTPRGVIAGGWSEAVRDLFGTLEGMRRIFRERSLYKTTGAAFSGNGYATGSSNAQVSLNGLATAEAKQVILDWLEREGAGNRRVNFKLRDWAFSRQRYWGEPFPIVYDEAGNHYPVSEKALPVSLPEMADYSPVESDDPQPLLAKATSWVNTNARLAGVDATVLSPDTPVRRETNTMPGSAGSSWYFLRYCDAANAARFVGREAEQYWMKGGVDLYLGGSEHAVGHLLYARFWQKILFDLGEVSEPEPFRKLFHQGMITSFAYQRPDKTLVPVDEVDEPREGEFIERSTGIKLTPIVAKMSKSLKNVVNPDDIIAQFGADTFRVYEMYMGPLAASKPWNTKDAVGIFRFLQRVWRLVVDEQTGELKLAAQAKPEIEKQLHRMTAKVDADIPKLAFNTAIAAMIEFINTATSAGGVTRAQLEMFTLALAPFAPHIAEELWSKLGHAESIAHAAFPAVDPKLLVDDVVEIPVQIGGKVRARISVPAASAADRAAIEKLAMADAAVQAALSGKTVTKIVVVPGKMVNVVAG